MKKHVLPFLAVLLLAACTPVENFGAYWDKGVVDPALEGTWKKIGLPGEKLDDTPGADTLLFVRDGPSYSFQSINPIDRTLPDHLAAQRKKDNDARSGLRTLKIGNHSFFMISNKEGTQKGMIERYEIKGDLLLQYSVDNGAAVDFLEAKHSAAKNIGRNRGEGRYVVIETFDDEVFQILSEISDDAAYWNLRCQYKKVP